MKKDKPRVTILEGGGLLVPDTVELVDQRRNKGENLNPVPRVARFEDLRVGQWVCLQDEHHARAGKITERYPHSPADNGSYVAIPFPQSDGATGFHVSRKACERGEVVILREAPAPPVTVRREDYDALVAAKNADFGGGSWAPSWGNLLGAARALIDNADTGETP